MTCVWNTVLLVSLLPYILTFGLMFLPSTCDIEPARQWNYTDVGGVKFVSEHIMRCNHTHEWGQVLPLLSVFFLPILYAVFYYTYCCAAERHLQHPRDSLELSRLCFKLAVFASSFGYTCLVTYDHEDATASGPDLPHYERNEWYLHAYGVALFFGGFLVTQGLTLYHYAAVHGDEGPDKWFSFYTIPQLIRRGSYLLLIVATMTFTIFFAFFFMNQDSEPAIVTEYILVASLMIILGYNLYVLFRLQDDNCMYRTVDHTATQINQKWLRIFLYIAGCALPWVGFLVIADERGIDL